MYKYTVTIDGQRFETIEEPIKMDSYHMEAVRLQKAEKYDVTEKSIKIYEEN